MTKTTADKKTKVVVFQKELCFQKVVYYNRHFRYEDFESKQLDDHPDWSIEYIKQIWMEFCAEACNWGTIEYKDAEPEHWEDDDFTEIFEECYYDDAVEKVNAKLKKD